MASSMQASYEEAMSAFKALTSVKSLKEAVDLQVGLARSAVEKSVTESSKYTDASFKLAGRRWRRCPRASPSRSRSSASLLDA